MNYKHETQENIAILMADLSGYTALTETHGAVAAADLIEQYIRIAEDCLTGDCRLHERNGDEIMIVSASPDLLLKTAMMISTKTAGEEHFLQIHGGLHTGTVLRRNNSYFGSAINFTSRLASRAKAGTFWCSTDYLNGLSENPAYKMESVGMQLFKNISKEMEVFEISIKNRNAVYIDPVCSMLLLNIREAVPHPNDDAVFFCSSHCREIYAMAH